MVGVSQWLRTGHRPTVFPVNAAVHSRANEGHSAAFSSKNVPKNVSKNVRKRCRASELPSAQTTVDLQAEDWGCLFQFVNRFEGRQYREDVMLVFKALKFAVDALVSYSAKFQTPTDARTSLQKGMSVASRLMELKRDGFVLDAETIAASLLVEQVANGELTLHLIEEELGPIVSSLVWNTLKIRDVVETVEVFDDATSIACREACLSHNDTRAIILEIMFRWDGLCNASLLPLHVQQTMALESERVFAPMAHVVGLGFIANELEEQSIRILFPKSYHANKAWLSSAMGKGPDVLKHIKSRLMNVLESNEELHSLVSNVQIHDRVKSLSSFMSKVLSLRQITKGGRERDEVFDILGVRIIVMPKSDADDLSASEDKAVRACYLVQDIVHDIWPVVDGRCKDYILNPKPNGYQSLHSTLKIDLRECSEEADNHNENSDENLVWTTSSTLCEDRADNVRSVANGLDFGGHEGDGNVADLSTCLIGLAKEEFGDIQDDLDLRIQNSDENLRSNLKFFEVQIRSEAMDINAEAGGSAHPLYKSRISQSVVQRLSRNLPQDIEEGEVASASGRLLPSTQV